VPRPRARPYAERLREAWITADAAPWVPVAEALLEAAPVPAGQSVLDAGCGAGDLAMLAAGRGAAATACDAAPLMELGRRRSGAVAWVDGDPERLPFADGSFDHVRSVFAPGFCADPRAAVAELLRVVRPGGQVAFTAWSDGGVTGALLALAARRDPPPVAPLEWARGLRAGLGPDAERVAVEPRALEVGFGSAADAVERLYRALPPLAAGSLFAETQATVTGARASAPYLVVAAARRDA
jgi:SAM-dependent methyltransferase